jgi:hypothetical protein
MESEAVKIFKAVGTLVGESYDRSQEIDAKFGATAFELPSKDL